MYASNKNRNGSALIISMFFVMIFSALAMAFSQMANMNLQIADNQSKGGKAYSNALSGLEFVRYWMKDISVPGSVAVTSRLSSVAGSLNTKLASTNIAAVFDGSAIKISDVALDTSSNEKFNVVIRHISDNVLQVDITGVSVEAARTIRVEYDFLKRGHSGFNFGVATRGPLTMQGNVELSGVNVAVEASVYIESLNQNQALSLIGNSHIAGEVSIANNSGYASLQGQSSIAGCKGAAAAAHVHAGVDQADFPTPVTDIFEPYCTNTITSSTQANSQTTWSNIKIAANSNPTFNSHTTLNGVVFIETPNVVTFSGGATVRGLIVGDGAVNEEAAPANQKLVFRGNVNSYPVTTLPDTEQYQGVRNQKGTFIVAPGFAVDFGGTFDTLNGVIAANGVVFSGNAGGEIHGSIINYSSTMMGLSGTSDLYFNRSGTEENPAGFMPAMTAVYRNNSYEEVALGE